jgi:hypothetical protein
VETRASIRRSWSLSAACGTRSRRVAPNTEDETRKKVDLAGFQKRFAGDNPLYVRGFHDGFLVPGIERAYDEAKFAKE